MYIKLKVLIKIEVYLQLHTELITRSKKFEGSSYIMGRRWTLQEETSLKEVRNILKDELAERIQFPEGILFIDLLIIMTVLYTHFTMIYP